MPGIIGLGHQFEKEAVSGMADLAQMETARENTEKQLKAARRMQRNSMIGSGLGLGAAFGPQIWSGLGLGGSAAGGLGGVTGGIAGAAAPGALGVTGGIAGAEGAGALGVTGGLAAAEGAAGAGAASGGLMAGAPALAAAAPIAIPALAIGGLAWLLSEFL